MIKYDVIVVGAGHAGAEAAAAAANLGSSTLLVTMNLQTIGQMSCNPAMGGVAKGQIVREIDALGGLSGIVTDASMIQFKMLNRSKGPAMWSPRAQCDRMLFSHHWRMGLEKISQLDFLQDMVNELVIDKDKVIGVKTTLGAIVYAKSVVLTNGTFLNGKIHIGETNYSGGRMAETSSKGITEQLVSLGFEAGRMKTGTPPRVDGRSLDYTKMEPDSGEKKHAFFSYLSTNRLLKQRDCFITHTNKLVHEALQEGFDRSPMFNGSIESTGPRYCPSIEDKIYRFADKSQHPIFVEPEGWETVEIYVNGFSTSLPQDVQEKAMRLIPGFEKVKIFRPGYAIEYDYFPPTQLKNTLETKPIKGLFFAGQINGTTGYEEAAAQGLMAGINAHLLVAEKEEFVMGRDESYIAVLIDDLITKGTEEPYRMFTSRAEFRMLLRQDNADARLTERSYNMGLASKERLDIWYNKQEKSKELLGKIEKNTIYPEWINPFLLECNAQPINQAKKMKTVLSRPGVTMKNFMNLPEIKEDLALQDYDEEVLELVEVEVKYAGYIDREKDNAAKLNRLENIKIPAQFEFSKIQSMSIEARQKLTKIQPATIGQAKRVSGVSPADMSALLVFLGR